MLLDIEYRRKILKQELRKHLKVWHPDYHANSQASTIFTRRLLALDKMIDRLCEKVKRQYETTIQSS